MQATRQAKMSPLYSPSPCLLLTHLASAFLSWTPWTDTDTHPQTCRQPSPLQTCKTRSACPSPSGAALRGMHLSVPALTGPAPVPPGSDARALPVLKSVPRGAGGGCPACDTLLLLDLARAAVAAEAASSSAVPELACNG